AAAVVGGHRDRRGPLAGEAGERCARRAAAGGDRHAVGGGDRVGGRPVLGRRPGAPHVPVALEGGGDVRRRGVARAVRGTHGRGGRALRAVGVLGGDGDVERAFARDAGEHRRRGPAARGDAAPVGGRDEVARRLLRRRGPHDGAVAAARRRRRDPERRRVDRVGRGLGAVRGRHAVGPDAGLAGGVLRLDTHGDGPTTGQPGEPGGGLGAGDGDARRAVRRGDDETVGRL